MRLSIIGLISAVGIWMVNISCERIRPEAPRITPLDSTLQIPVSKITIPIQYEVTKLEKMVNDKIQGVFLKEGFKVNTNGDSLFLQIEKQGRIILSWSNPTLYYSVPVKVSAKFMKRVGKMKVRNNKPVETELVLRLSTRLDIDKNWQLKPQSALEEIKWITDPKLKIALVKINLRKVAEDAINKNKDKLIAKMDEIIPVLLNTRNVVSKLWNDIQKPIRINKKETQVWLKAYGTNITARLTDAGPDLIALKVQLKAHLQTVMEGETMPGSNDTLPAYAVSKSDDDSLLMYVLVRIPFEPVSKILNDQLVGKDLSAEGYSTKIRKLDLYGTDSALALKVKVKGDVDGQVFITAAPGYDTLSSTLYAKRFAFDIDTENSLVSSANWLLHDNVLDLVRNKMKIGLQPYIDSLPALIIRGIERGKTGTKIDLTINSLTIKPVNSLITRDDFQILFKATGQASIDLEQKIFTAKKKKGKKRVRF